jgi:hypothetical protein
MSCDPCGDAPAPPPAPDYRGAATETAAGNLDMARLATKANRPDEFTPLGNRRWFNDGNDNWSSAINLSPEGQGLFDQQLRISQNLGNVGEQGLSRVGSAVAQPFDMSGIPQAPGVPTAGDGGRDKVVQALMARQQPAMDRNRQSREAALIAQGHTRGGSAWDAQQDDLNRGENDARLAAEIAGGQEQSRQYGLDAQGYSMGTDARSRAVQEQAFMRQLPLNELNALRTGSQVGMPQFQAYGQQQTTPGPNFSGATQQQGLYDTNLFNQQATAANEFNKGLFSLGSAAMGFF